ncbi:MAG: FtsX-like permease family protein, partial [Bacteroidota bacterium]
PTTPGQRFLHKHRRRLLAGKSYTTNLQSDVEKVIINESAARAFGWEPREAVGNQFYRVGQSYVEVIGVVKDFHMFSMHLTIQPLIIAFRNDYFNYASLKLKPENLPETISLIEKTVNEYSSYPFEYQFMDAEFDRMYKSDIKLGKIFGFFTVLSIIVASLGLFGLAAFTAKQRTKEIGIRKVLGASVKAIVALIAKDFVKMVVIGFLLALPLAWYINDLWLQDYAYRIELQWWIFGVAGIIAIVLSIFTISSQSLKASMANPVDSLRNE